MTESIDYGRLSREIAIALSNSETKPKPHGLSAAEVEDIASRAAREAVEKAVPLAISATLLGFGLDPAQRLDIQRDMLFIRDMRTLSADSRKHVLLAVLSTLTLGVVSAVWLYLKSTGKTG